MTPSGLLILGFGGHARSVADIAVDCGIKDLAFVEPTGGAAESFAGFPVHRSVAGEPPDGWSVFPASGDNTTRRAQVEHILARGWRLDALSSRRAYIGAEATILSGALVAHHAHVGPLARIGRGAIVNTGAIVEHETKVDDFAHIAVNATVAGRCHIGRLVFIGAGATIIDGIQIADGAVIGAGSTVIADISAPGVYVGSPARRVRSLTETEWGHGPDL